MTRKMRILRGPLTICCLLMLVGGGALVWPEWFERIRPLQAEANYGDVISLCAFVATIVTALLTVVPSLQSMADTSRSAHYSELDDMYLHLLTMAVERPFLRTPERQNASQRAQYDPYAFMVWNFLETIHDRCADDEELLDTWLPIVAAEHAVHRVWFARETVPYEAVDSPKFRLKFCDFVWRAFWMDEAQAGMPRGRTRTRAAWPYRSEAQIAADPGVAQWLYPADTNSA